MPNIRREGVEAQKQYAIVDTLRGGDSTLCPQDEKGYGYDVKYEQLDAQGYKTLADNVKRFDDRAAIIILGHNLLQQVGKGGSYAALKGALELLKPKTEADAKVLSVGLEPVSKAWARANWGCDARLMPELCGKSPERLSWSLVFDFTDSEEKKAAGVRSAQFAQGFATFSKAVGPEKMLELPIDYEEAAERAGIPMMGGEDSYTQDDDDDAELDGESYINPPLYVKQAANRSLDWLHLFKYGASDAARQTARKIVRGHLLRADILRMAKYFEKHTADKNKGGWANLSRPSSQRINWGLYGDNGDGRGLKWAQEQANQFVVLADMVPVVTPALTATPTTPTIVEQVFKPVDTIGKSKRVKDMIGIASVAVFDAHGRLLFGRRRDDGKWTLPGGHMEPGEAPEHAAKRELWEESGITTPLTYIGCGSIDKHIIHSYTTIAENQVPTNIHDPDEETDLLIWVDIADGKLPPAIAVNLHSPKNVTLAILNLGPSDGITFYQRTELSASTLSKTSKPQPKPPEPAQPEPKPAPTKTPSDGVPIPIELSADDTYAGVNGRPAAD